jgi:AcrR family transcriptional regulator
MTADVNPRRTYNSARRQEQARATRRRALESARQMLLERGYAGTTIPAVAAEAGMSVPSAYQAFGNKAGLLKAVFDVAIAGDDEPVAVVDRPLLRAVREQPDARRKLELYGEFVAHTAPRQVPIQLIARDAATADPEAAATWELLRAERLRGMTMFAADLAQTKELRPGVTRTVARDLLWTYSSPETYDLLVNQRGWSARRYGRWVAQSLVAALLAPSDPA